MQIVNKKFYQPAEKSWYSGRNSGKQLYLHEIIQQAKLSKISPASDANHFALLGYACDHGVELNLGRPGAKKGPAAFRKQLGTISTHLPNNTQIIDVGNIIHNREQTLRNTQNQLANAVAILLSQNYHPIVVGGGHDIAFGHFLGIHQYFSNQNNIPKIGILNFDAHLDLRKAEGGNSGTPFSQIADFVGEENFYYCALGIRKESNHRDLLQRAESLGTTIIPIESCVLSQVQQIQLQINSFLEKVDVLYVTVDLDGFSSAFAPGVSAPHPFGLSPEFVLPILQYIIHSKKVISIDFAELNPKYDVDGQTAKLAAYLVYQYIFYRC